MVILSFAYIVQRIFNRDKKNNPVLFQKSKSTKHFDIYTLNHKNVTFIFDCNFG